MGELIKQVEGQTVEKIRERMKAAGISVTELAREMGVHRMTLVQVLSGRSKGRNGAAHAVHVLLGLKPGAIVAKDAGSLVDIVRGDKT